MMPAPARRILVVDDNADIQDVMLRILRSSSASSLAVAHAALFGAAVRAPAPCFEVDSAMQGQAGLARIVAALAEHRPYQLAFVDMRMPPGWDGLGTTERILSADPDVFVVLCTAYSDATVEQIHARLGTTERVLILKKPFDPAEILQLANTLTEQWLVRRGTTERTGRLEGIVRDLQASASTSNRPAGLAPDAPPDLAGQRAFEADLRGGVERNEFHLHYQPLVRVNGRQVIAFEALLRWRHEKWGAQGAGRVIAVAEETGLIHPLGLWVLQEAGRQLSTWGPAGPGVSVNLSPSQLVHPALPDQIAALLSDARLPPDRLTLEISETALLPDPAAARRALHQIAALGSRIYLDDFGTGASSITHLDQLPLTGVKIDGALISTLGTGQRPARVVEAVVTMARAFDLDVVAEGVETAEQLAVLRDLGCEYAQGFLLGRPASAAQATLLLRAAGPAVAG